jgi:HSP20 family protein
VDDDPEDDWMWERARALLDSVEQFQRRAFGVAPPGGRTPIWTPPVDVFEQGSMLWVLVALPGTCAESVAVRATENHLIVEGHRGLPEAFRNAHVHRLETPYGHFRRQIDLPRGRFVLEQRDQVQGCLVLRLRRVSTTEQ